MLALVVKDCTADLVKYNTTAVYVPLVMADGEALCSDLLSYCCVLISGCSLSRQSLDHASSQLVLYFYCLSEMLRVIAHI